MTIAVRGPTSTTISTRDRSNQSLLLGLSTLCLMFSLSRVTRLTGWRCTQAPLCFVFFCGCGLYMTVLMVQLLHDDPGTLIWCLRWAPPPVRMLPLCILFSARRSVLECQCQPFSSPATCFSHVQLHDFQQGQLFAAGERCNRVLLQYSRAQLFKMTPARLTLDLISHLRSMQIGVDLPRKRSRRGGRRKKKPTE